MWQAGRKECLLVAGAGQPPASLCWLCRLPGGQGSGFFEGQGGVLLRRGGREWRGWGEMPREWQAGLQSGRAFPGGRQGRLVLDRLATVGLELVPSVEWGTVESSGNNHCLFWSLGKQLLPACRTGGISSSLVGVGLQQAEAETFVCCQSGSYHSLGCG